MPKIPKNTPLLKSVEVPKTESQSPLHTLDSLVEKRTLDLSDRLEGFGPLSVLNGLTKISQLVTPRAGTRRSRPYAPSRSAPEETTEDLLYNRIRHQSDSPFLTMSYTAVPNRYGVPLPLDNASRIKALEQILVDHPTLSIHDHDKDFATLAHHIILNPAISGKEQAELIHYLAEKGVDFSTRSEQQFSPLDLAINLDEIEPQAIEALLSHGAQMDLPTRYRIIGHLTGLSGTIVLETEAGKGELQLTEMAPKDAEFSLDPAFRTALRTAGEVAPDNIRGLLEAIEERWNNTRDSRPLINNIEVPHDPKETPRASLEVLITGWQVPQGHAVSFACNREEDGVYLYACNTGVSSNHKRSIVRYRVTDEAKASEFFRNCQKDRDNTRLFFTEKPKNFGFQRCSQDKQIPLSLDKSFQKRENCPITSRKACLLAMLWSEGQRQNIPQKTIENSYKQITSLLRQYGAELALSENNPQLMGRTMVKLLTKLDRPDLKETCYRLAVAIIEHHETTKGHPLHAPLEAMPAWESNEYLTTLQTALSLSGEDLNTIFERHGKTLSEHAEDRGNPEAAAILKRLSKPTKRFSRYLQLDFWKTFLDN